MTIDDKKIISNFVIKHIKILDDIDATTKHLTDLKRNLQQHLKSFNSEIYKRKIALPIAFKYNEKIVYIDTAMKIKIFNSAAEIDELLEPII